MRLIQKALTFDDVLLVPGLLQCSAARHQPENPG